MLDSQTRLDLARRLHDGLAQDLAVLGYKLDEVIGDPRLEQSLRDSLRDIRINFSALSVAFRDEIYRIRTLTRAQMQNELNRMLVDLESQVDLEFPEFIPEAEDALAHCLFEIARNCIQHSKARTFRVKSQIVEADLKILCSDDGIGQISPKERSFGLQGIREWLATIGAEIEFISGATGSEIEILIPNFARLAR